MSSLPLTIRMCKSRMCLIRLFPRLRRPHEHHRHTEHADDRQHLVRAFMLRRGYEHLRELRVKRKFGDHVTDRRHVALIVERAEVVQHLECAHQRLGSGRIHEVEMDEVVDLKLLKVKDDAAQRRTEELGVRGLDQFALEGGLGVKAEGLGREGKEEKRGEEGERYNKQIIEC